MKQESKKAKHVCDGNCTHESEFNMNDELGLTHDDTVAIVKLAKHLIKSHATTQGEGDDFECTLHRHPMIQELAEILPTLKPAQAFMLDDYIREEYQNFAAEAFLRNNLRDMPDILKHKN